MLGSNLLLNEQAREFKVRIGDITRGVLVGDKALSDVSGKFGSPNDRWERHSARLEGGEGTCSVRGLAVTVVDGGSSGDRI
jgi:hypothetical protein